MFCIRMHVLLKPINLKLPSANSCKPVNVPGTILKNRAFKPYRPVAANQYCSVIHFEHTYCCIKAADTFAIAVDPVYDRFSAVHYEFIA